MKARFILKLGGLAAVLGLSACRREVQVAPPPAPRVEANQVIFASGAPQLESLTTEAAKPRPTAVTKVTGRLLWDDDLTVNVFTPVAGRVTSIAGRLGQTVTANSPLARLIRRTSARRRPTHEPLMETCGSRRRR